MRITASPLRRLRLRGLLAAALVAGLMLAAAGPAPAQISLLGLKNSLVDFVLDQISVEGAFEISAEGVEEPEDGSTELVGVTIADADGVWFRAEAMALSWNASRILRGELEINSLVIRGMEVLRRPTPPEVTVKEDSELDQAGFDPFAWPRSPIATRVERLALENAYIAEGVIAEQSLRFGAEGDFRDEGDIQSLTLNIAREDEVEGEIALDYVRDFSDESLNLTLNAQEAPGGLTAALAGLPGDSASSLSLEAEGPLVDWGLTLSAEAERVLSVQGDATIDARAPVSVNAGLSVTPGPELSEAARTALGEAARLDLEIAETEDGRVRIETGRFESPSATAQVSGEFIRAEGRMDFDLSLEARRQLAALAEGLDFERIGFDGRLEGTTEDFEATGAASLSGFSTAAADIGEAQLDVTAGLAGERASLTAEGLARAVRLDRLGPELLGETRLRIEGDYALDAQRAELAELAVTSPLLSLEAAGAVDLEGETAELDYSVSTPELGPVAEAYEVDAGGRFSAEGRAEGPFSALALGGEARAEDLSFQGRGWSRVVARHQVTVGEVVEGNASVEADGTPYGPASVATDFRLEGERLELSGMTAQALEATAEGALRMDLATLLAEGAVTLDAPRLAAFSDLVGTQVSGRARGEIAFSRAEGAQVVTLDLTGEEAAAQGFSLDKAALKATLRDALGAPNAQYGISASGLRGPDLSVESLQASGEATDLTGAPAATYDIRVEGVSAQGARVASAEVEGEASDLTGAPRAAARAVLREIEAPDGAATVAELRLDLEGEDLISAPRGRVEATARTLRAGGASVDRVTLTAQGEDLVAAPSGTAQAEATGLTLADGVTLRALRLDAQGRALASEPQGEVEITALGLSAAEMAEMPRVVLTASGGLSDLTLRLRGQGSTAQDEPISLAMDAAGALAGEGAALRVSRLEASAGEAALRARRPFTVGREGAAGWRLSDLDIALPGGGLRGAAALHDDGASGDLSLEIDDLSVPAGLVEAPVDGGRLSLEADFDTRPGRAQADIRATARELAFADIPDDSGSLGVDVSTRWNGSVMRVDGEISGPFGDAVRLEASHPLVPSGGPIPRVPQGGALDAGLVWAGRVETIWPLLPLPDHVLRGQLDLDLKLVGDISDPKFSGSVSLEDGAYQNLELGTILTDLSLGSRLRQGGGLIVEFFATDGAGAPLEGRVELEGKELSARASADGAVLVRREDVTAAASLDIRAEGPLAAPRVTGEVRVERAEVRLVNATPPSVPTLDVVVKGAPREERSRGRERGPRLDLSIVAPGNIFVRGRGLDSEWEMDLKVTGAASAPRVQGEISRRRGRLDFLGRAFDLVRGSVRFDGGREIDPQIDVALEHERADITGRIAVRGRVSDPEIAFESQPALPESEVLPRVIFGQPRQSLTAGQAVQLASGVATLMSGDEGVLGNVRSAVGLDVLSVDTSGESTAVRAGRNVAEGVFVGVKQPVDGGAAAVEVEVELRSNVTVDAETGSEEGSSVGLNWKYDF